MRSIISRTDTDQFLTAIDEMNNKWFAEYRDGLEMNCKTDFFMKDDLAKLHYQAFKEKATFASYYLAENDLKNLKSSVNIIRKNTALVRNAHGSYIANSNIIQRAFEQVNDLVTRYQTLPTIYFNYIRLQLERNLMKRMAKVFQAIYQVCDWAIHNRYPSKSGPTIEVKFNHIFETKIKTASKLCSSASSSLNGDKIDKNIFDKWKNLIIQVETFNKSLRFFLTSFASQICSEHCKNHKVNEK